MRETGGKRRARKRLRDFDGAGVFPEDVDDRERVPGHPLCTQPTEFLKLWASSSTSASSASADCAGPEPP